MHISFSFFVFIFSILFDTIDQRTSVGDNRETKHFSRKNTKSLNKIITCFIQASQILDARKKI